MKKLKKVNEKDNVDFNKKNKKTNDTSNKKNKKLKKQIIEKIIYIFIGFSLCIVFLFVLSGKKNYIKLYYELKEFIDVYDIISNEYYGELDKNALVNDAINSMLESVGDDFTTFIDKQGTDKFLENVNGTYEGIGCTISTDLDGNIIIVDVFDDSPASKSGLVSGDIILKVDEMDCSNMTSSDLSNYVKNNSNKDISFTISRDGKVLNKNLKREKVEVPNVTGKVINYFDNNIGYININLFSDISYKQFSEKLKDLEKKDITGLIVDVRNNSGGYLSVVTNISSLFLKKGDIIYQLENEEKVQKIKDTTSENRSYPIAVLVNGSSASASEIFAAAIKESYGGYIVGTNTYGKGTVQKTKLLDDGSMIKYTVQKWLTPDGNFINKVGITPTNIIEYSNSLDYDNQLDEALKLVTSG